MSDLPEATTPDPVEATPPDTVQASAADEAAPDEAGGPPTPRGQLLFWALILVILAASVPLHLGSPTPDVNWLLTMCDKILAGEVAYVDILETTPPVPALLYMPAVMAGQALGVSAESVLLVMIYGLGLLSLVLLSWILPQDTLERSRFARTFLFAAAVGLFVTPADSFAQREFFAAMFGLPIVAVFIRHAQTKEWPPISARLIAGVLAALMIAIKPPLFALPGAFLFGYYLWRTRSFRSALSSGLIPAGVLGVLITIASLAAFPEFFGPVWDLMREVYIPAKSGPLTFLGRREGVAMLGAFGGVVYLASRSENHTSSLWLLLATGIGYFAVYLLQGKFYGYHAYPAVLVGSIALAVASVERVASVPRSGRRVLGCGLGVVWIVVSWMTWSSLHDLGPKMKDLSWAAELEAPTMVAISPDLATAFPLTRRLGGKWVHSTHSQWVARMARSLHQDEGLSPERREALVAYYTGDLVRLLNCIEREAPDLIVVDLREDFEWLMEALEELRPHFLDGYTKVAEEGRIRVLKRRSK
ncbi:MAG: hypothetical protein JKY65_17480 [Planctomycetes bacterium]|nr:hypothetical protein [Planctomycetota bacterium]